MFLANVPPAITSCSYVNDHPPLNTSANIPCNNSASNLIIPIRHQQQQLPQLPSPVIPLPPLQPRPPPVTENILVLYCKDQFLQVTPEVTPDNRRSVTDYCQEVSDFVETLTHLSNKHDDSGRVYQAYQFTYDRVAADGTFIDNFLSWSDAAISNCSTIVLLCSPQLADSLQDDQVKVIPMELGMFHKHSLINAFAQKTVIPVFLNMPKCSRWVPQPLQFAASYVANIKVLQEGCAGVRNQEEWSERVYSLLRDERRLEDLLELWKILRKEGPVGIQPHPPPISLPVIANISREQLVELAADVSFIWQQLATKLGVPFNTQQRIQNLSSDCNQKTIMMFDEWIKEKRQDANKRALVQGLRSCRYNAIADRVETNFP